MKKTISINLQGIIFHVEEDGYTLLSSYLSSVKSYFAAFEGHEEIMADIESRMAEIFLTRVSPGKQIISLEDVQYLIGRMGSVQDFAAQAAEEEAEAAAAGAGAAGSGPSSAYTGPGTGPKKLYLDMSRKKLAGVCAGLANYLDIDPLWMRLLFVVLVLGSPLTGGGTAGFAVLAYIIMWIVLPQNYSLPDVKAKKLYRDPDDKKLSGVSAGIGHYFGVDPTWIRLLFVVLVLFFGTGVLIYIVLWIVMPEAKTPSEKAEMHGNPVTLSSIEAAIRSNQAFKDERGQENALARVLLLPVQLLSQLIEAVGPALRAVIFFLLNLVRVLAGLLLMLMSLALIAAAVLGLLVAFGAITDGIYNSNIDGLPLELFIQDLPWWGIIAGFLTLFLPALFLLLVGLSLIAKRNLIRQAVGWTLLGLFIPALVLLAVAMGLYFSNFRQSGEFREETPLQMPQSQALHMKIEETDGVYFEDLYLDIAPTTQPNLLLQSEYRAKGRNREEAIAAARMINTPYRQTDSVLVFKSGLTFRDGARFRNQRLNLKLLIPEGRQFTLDEGMAGQADIAAAGSMDPGRLAGKMLMYEGGKLRCLNCTAADSADSSHSYSSASAADSVEETDDDFSTSGSSRVYSASGFSEVEAAGGITVVIRKSNTYRVRAHGSRDAQRHLEIEEEGNRLRIENKHKFWNRNSGEKITVVVEMPDLQGIRFAGAVKGKASGFSPSHLEVDLVGASSMDLRNINCHRLTANLVGASTLTASGTTQELTADVIGASELNARELQARTARVEATGASRARVQVQERLEAEASGASSVHYSGNPKQVEADEGAAGTISKE